ncbi:MAG: acyl-CoA synthetase, partial [Burkholderiales bacterium]|nr:acyl-CoA synthetase [Burkholderiales bacterium]
AAAAPRRHSRRYLARVLGRPPRWRERFAHIHAFASTVHDRVFLLNDRSDLFDIQVRGGESIEAALAGGRGALLLGAGAE